MIYIIIVLIACIAVLINYFFSKPEKKKVYDADFSSLKEHLSSKEKGFCLDGRHCLKISTSLRGAIAFGNSGSFKTAGILTPSILRMMDSCSLVINNPSDEIYVKTSGPLDQSKSVIKTVDFSNPEISEGFNPLQRSKGSSSKIAKMSKMITLASLGSSNKDPFWNLSCENLISLASLFITRNMEEQFHTLANVYRLISLMLYASQKADKLFIKDSTLLPEYKSFIAYGDKTLASIIATCRSALQMFGTDDAIMRITSHDTIDFSELRKTRTAIFINTNITDQKHYALCTSLFLQQCFAELMRELPGESLPIFFLLDECSSLYFEQLQIVLANCRKYNFSLFQIYQSPSQLYEIHGMHNAKAILENCYARVYMGGQTIQTSQELEATLGKFEYVDDKGSRQVRSLLTANEIHELSESLIFLGNNRAIKAPITPYFKQRRLNKLTQLPPCRVTTKSGFKRPPLFQID